MEYSKLIVATIILIAAMAAVTNAGMIIAASRTTATASIAIMGVITRTSRRHTPMRKHSWKISLAWLTRVLLAWIAFSSAGLALASVPDTQSAALLHAKYASLGERLHHNPFQRALSLDSSESSNDLKGDIYALVDYPFATVSAALNGPEHWCDVLILHINTKYCHATTDETRTVLMLSVGKKTFQPLDDAYPIEFSYRVAAATPKYLAIQLNAQEGPLGTRDYRIQLQAVPVGNGQTFLHLTYSCDFGMAGRLAMKTYFATLGSDKVGFTQTGKQTNGQPELIGGMRGVVERNTMRYYLCLLYTSPSPRD